MPSGNAQHRRRQGDREPAYCRYSAQWPAARRSHHAQRSSVQTGVSAGYGMRTGALISVAGSSIEGVQYNFDGAPHINTLDGSGMPLPFSDALQEFKVSISVQDASNRGHSGATVNSVTKSGTNTFHGDLFEFLRNYD